MKIRDIEEKDYKDFFEIVAQFNEGIKYEEFLERLEIMKGNGYKVVAGFDEMQEMVAVSGMWENARFWCGKYLEIDNFLVHEKKRCGGVGKIMLRFIIEHAKKQGVNCIILNAYNENVGAAKFYKKNGFEDIGNFFKLEIAP